MSSDMITEQSRDLFFVESRDMLEQMESCLLSLEKDSSDKETMNALFRTVHTIKGSSGMFDLTEVEAFTHVVENVLDDVRNGRTPVNFALIELMLRSHDMIEKMVTLLESDPSAKLEGEDAGARDGLVSMLKSYIVDKDPKSEEKIKSSEKEQSVVTQEVDPEVENIIDRVKNEYLHISLRFNSDFFKNGLDPLTFVTYLNQTGKIKNLLTIYDNLPVVKDLDPEACYIGFEIDYDTTYDKRKIEELFDFIKDECSCRIIPPMSSIKEYVNLIKALPEENMKIGEMLHKIGSLTSHELNIALDMQKAKPKEAKPYIGDILVEEQMVDRTVLDAALKKQQSVEKVEDKKSKTIRIDAEKLDELINIVGELVINSAAIKQILGKSRDTRLMQSVINMSRLIEDVRDRTMNIRMVQIGDTFKRFERTVHDLGREMGKEIDLLLSGNDAELDKTLIEKISDPLMHLVRNSIDHGIESPEERVNRGKPRRGTVRMNAYHESGSIVIEVIDDGKGLNRDKILEKARKIGMVQDGAELTDSDVFQFIFEPGFSTAEKVTNISGRGVGMDVVKRNIEALRGTITLDSVKGSGTTVRIHLPLTLAIIDGFMIQIGEMFYILPLDMVVEGLEVKSAEVLGKSGGNYFNLRGDVLPFLRLREYFGDNTVLETENIIVVEYARKKIGLVGDRLIGEFQTVIKPLGRLFNRSKWISGATILGTGEVALILDVPKLIQSARII